MQFLELLFTVGDLKIQEMEGMLRGTVDASVMARDRERFRWIWREKVGLIFGFRLFLFLLLFWPFYFSLFFA